MNIPILIEPLDTGEFRAKSGDPFAATAEGKTANEAAEQLADVLRSRFQGGIQFGSNQLGNGIPIISRFPIPLEPIPEDDWFFKTMWEAIDENRRK